MKTPALGKLVKYIRADEAGELHEGEGSVQAVFLDPRNRAMVRVKDGEHDFNVDLMAINPDKAIFAAYDDLHKRVKEVSEEGNELVKVTVECYNAKVEDIYSELLGEPVEVETADDEQETND